MDRMKIVDVSAFEDDVHEKITGGVFDPERFDLVRAGKGASKEAICELVEDAPTVALAVVN
ncbi:MAG: hypothetical protein NWE88_02665 [Candidatus Bathyarchaeota archaeon]|nr:hypothetical protein [Candidatus Bathyarchaeota archaeon]